MNFDEDIQTINFIVNTSPNQEVARERFFKTVGFALPEEMAKQELENAIKKRFYPHSVIKKEIERLAGLVSKPAESKN